jgi:hypothetical protein
VVCLPVTLQVRADSYIDFLRICGASRRLTPKPIVGKALARGAVTASHPRDAGVRMRDVADAQTTSPLHFQVRSGGGAPFKD